MGLPIATPAPTGALIESHGGYSRLDEQTPPTELLSDTTLLRLSTTEEEAGLNIHRPNKTPNPTTNYNRIEDRNMHICQFSTTNDNSVTGLTFRNWKELMKD